MSEKTNAAKPLGPGEGLTFVLTVYAASRLFYLLAGALLADVLPISSFYHHSSDDPFGTLNLWAHWDGDWYTTIASQGYETGEPGRAAFFPLYPLTVRFFAELFGGPLSPGALSLWGVIVSMLALPFGFYFVYRIAENEWGAEVARSAVLILAFFPVSFFLNSVYTESLFLALSAGSLWALMVRRDLFLACLFAAFATATRNFGIFLLAPLAIEWLREARTYRWRGVWLALAPSGLLAYSGYLWARFGSPLLFQTAQENWNRHLVNPLTFVVEVWTRTYSDVVAALGPRSPDTPALRDLMNRLGDANNVYDLLFWILAVALLVLGARVLPASLSVYAFLMVVPVSFVGTAEAPLLGFPRYVLVTFPLFITLATLLKTRRTFGVWIALSVAASLVFCAMFVTWRFVA